MPRMSAADRHEAIVEAALTVMLRKGMAATTVRDVAEQMGTSSGLIHHYVESMDDLLAAAFDRAAGQDLEATRVAMGRGLGPLERLAIFFATYARAEQAWAFQLWLDAWAEASRRPAVRRSSQRLNVAWQQMLMDAIVDATATGEVRCEDADGAAWRILSLLDGLALQWVAHEVSIDRSAVITWSVAFTEAELGLRPGRLQALLDARAQDAPSAVGEG